MPKSTRKKPPQCTRRTRSSGRATQTYQVPHPRTGRYQRLYRTPESSSDPLVDKGCWHLKIREVEQSIGYGVFNDGPEIPAGAYLTTYDGPVKYVKAESVDLDNMTHLRGWSFYVGGDLLVIAGFTGEELLHRPGFGVGSVVNHSDDPNCEMVKRTHPFTAVTYILIRCVRPIQPEEELRVRYARSAVAYMGLSRARVDMQASGPG